MGMIRSMATVSGFTLLSRILGLIREILIARFLGTGAVADAFVAAFRLPNMFRRIFGEGAFNAAFVPLFARELEEHGREEATRFASRTFSLMSVVLIVGTLIAIPAMPAIMHAFAHGYAAEKFEITVAMGRIMFSYLLCMALSAQLSGVLNTIRIFAMPAFAPVLLNLIFITALLVGVPALGITKDMEAIGILMSQAVFIAGFAQLVLLFTTCRAKGLAIRFVRPTVSPRIKRLFILMLPGIAAAGIQQLNLVIGTTIASHQEGGNAFLYYADRLNQLPLGMIGIAFGVVLLPDITRKLRSDNKPGAIHSMNRGIELALLITLPSAVAIGVLAEPLIALIYERNEFTADSTRNTALALQGFTIGLPAYVLVKVLQPGFFAREDTKRPMIMAAITVAVNVIFSLILFHYFKHIGIAIATSISGWVNVWLLHRGLKGFFKTTPLVRTRILRMTIAAALMGLALFFAHQFMHQWFENGSLMNRMVEVAILIVLGTVSYAILVLSMGATTMSELKAAIGKK